ncbi:hypothetical protein GQ457_16G019660 [Hibiscus cannabinus]
MFDLAINTTLGHKNPSFAAQNKGREKLSHSPFPIGLCDFSSLWKEFSRFFLSIFAYHVPTTFTCPYGTFSFRRMSFGLYNAPATFQRCMMVIFSDMNEYCLEIFMDDFSTFGDDFTSCLSNLEKVLTRCEEKNRVLN